MHGVVRQTGIVRQALGPFGLRNPRRLPVRTGTGPFGTGVWPTCRGSRTESTGFGSNALHDVQRRNHRARAARRGKRDARSSRGWLKVLGVGAAVLALLFAGSRLSLLPGLDDFFGEETHDRSGPAVLKSIQDMSAYEAASGNFQVVVDLEKDTKFVPDVLRGTRTLFVGPARSTPRWTSAGSPRTASW